MNWASTKYLHLIYHPKQKGTYRSACWEHEYFPDLCWVTSSRGCPQPAKHVVLENCPHSQHRLSLIHVGLTLPIIRSFQKKLWNFQTGPSSKTKQKRAIVTIPRCNISIEETYTGFTGAIAKGAPKSIPRGLRPLYVPCMAAEATVLLSDYEKSGDPDIVDHLIEVLDAGCLQI